MQSFDHTRKIQAVRTDQGINIELLINRCIIMSLTVTDLVPLCVSVGGTDERFEGTGQCGRLALQGGEGYVLLTATPQSSCHCRLPGEV